MSTSFWTKSTKSKVFRYLDSRLNKDGETKGCHALLLSHSSQVGIDEVEKITFNLCDKRMPTFLKSEIYKTMSALYRLEIKCRKAGSEGMIVV